jgi:hypothetical protein
MKFVQSQTVILISLTLLTLGACSSGNQTSNSATSSVPATKPSEAASPSTTTNTSSASKHGGQGGQVVETGVYHLELLTLKEAEGTHLDFFLQKGDNHEPVPNAKVTAQVQMPDGTQKTLDLKYDAQGKHYAAVLPGTSAGEYKVAILSDIAGEKINGRFSFTK